MMKIAKRGHTEARRFFIKKFLWFKLGSHENPRS